MRSISPDRAAAGAYDLGPPLENRAFLQNSQSHAEQARLLAEARRWLFPVLARGHGFGQHPLRQLWHRTDWLATTELLSLAMNVRRLKRNPQNDHFLRRCREKACSLDRANRTGALWELWSAAIIDRSEHRIRPAANAAPGFDLWVECATGQRLRVSCKALNPSDNEREFRAFAEDVQAQLEALLVPTDRLLIFMLLDTGLGRPAVPAERLARAVREQADARKGQADFAIGGWYVHVRPYQADEPLWQGEASYSLMMASTYPKDEQRRFTSKLDDAVSNLEQHCLATPAGTTNAIFMKVPPPISMKNAVALVEETLAAGHGHLGAVHLFRSQLVVQQVGGAAILGHEYRCVSNPHATEPPAALHVELPIGTLIDEPKRGLFLGDKERELGNVYLFSGGRRCVQAKVEGNELRFRPVTSYTDSYVSFGVVGGQSIRIDRPGPPNWTLIV